MQKLLKFLEPLHAFLTSWMVKSGLILCSTDTLLTISMITQEALFVLENEITFAGNVNREYDDKFGIDGAKIGDTINIRRPPRFLGTSGPNLSVEDYLQTSLPLTLGNSQGTNPYGDQFHVDVAFTTKDLRLSLDKTSSNLIRPAVAAVANRIDYIGLLMAKNSTANIVGVPGTPPSSYLTYLTAKAYLQAEGAPKNSGEIHTVMEPFTSATIVDSLKGLLVPDTELSKQYREGRMGRAAGMGWDIDQNVISQTFGSWVAGTVGTLTANTTTQAGFTTAGWAASSTITLTNSATLTLNQGDVISIAGLFPVNPQNRQVYGSKTRTFVVQNTVTQTGGGTFSVTVVPAIITAGQFQNTAQVGATSATAAVTPFNIGVSSVGQASPQNLVFHKNAYVLGMADLPMPRSASMGSRASSKQSNLSIRVVSQYTINNDQEPMRFDSLFGWAQQYQELATRVCA